MMHESIIEKTAKQWFRIYPHPYNGLTMPEQVRCATATGAISLKRCFDPDGCPQYCITETDDRGLPLASLSFDAKTVATPIIDRIHPETTVSINPAHVLIALAPRS